MGQGNSSINGYIREEKLDAGAFGEVYKVRHIETNEVYALKVIKCNSDEDLNNVVGEMKVLSKLSHPNIVRYFEGTCEQNESFTADLSLMFEYCSGGNLNKRLQQYSSKKINLKWMRQLAHAISYLHSRNLVHRDLKPDNILLSSTDDIKVGDFGFSRDFVAMKREDETWECYYMADGCGTLCYLAPEVISDHYTEKADVFALGVLFYAIEERTQSVINGTRCYGVFVRESDGEEFPLGLRMFMDKNGFAVPFRNSDVHLTKIIGSTLLCDQKRRPNASTIKAQLNDYVV